MYIPVLQTKQILHFLAANHTNFALFVHLSVVSIRDFVAARGIAVPTSEKSRLNLDIVIFPIIPIEMQWKNNITSYSSIYKFHRRNPIIGIQIVFFCVVKLQLPIEIQLCATIHSCKCIRQACNTIKIDPDTLWTTHHHLQPPMSQTVLFLVHFKLMQ